MIRSARAKSSGHLSRAALAAALALGTMSGLVAAPQAAMAAPAKEKAAKLAPSKGFVTVAGPAQKAFDEAKANPAVTAAKAQYEAALQSRNEAQIKTARAALNTALAPQLAMLESVFGAIEKEDDRYFAGTLALNLGSTALEPALQRRGLKAMVQSGLTTPADTARFSAALGQLAYQAHDYAEAIQYIQPMVQAGTADTGLLAILAESQIASGQSDAGLEVFESAIRKGKAAGQLSPESWYRRAIGSAYKVKNINRAASLGSLLVADYPTSANVGLAVTVLRDLGNFGSQETLDLIRLMGRTNSYAEPRDYVEYIQAADARRLPGEVLEVINAGIASGKLKATDTFVVDAKTQASGRLAADKATLGSYEQDARKANATEVTVSGAADAMLSYGNAAAARDLYAIALTKPGVDANRALTRMGIAELTLGKLAEAQATFAKVTGPRKPIAMLWSAYAAGKASPPAIAPAPAK